jgi:thiol-disulfide isomerase/thioredoxin
MRDENRKFLDIAGMLLFWLVLMAAILVICGDRAFAEISRETQQELLIHPPAYGEDGKILDAQKWGNQNITLSSYARTMRQKRKRVKCACTMCFTINHWKAAFLDGYQLRTDKEVEESEETKELPRPLYGATSSENMDAGIRLADIGPLDIVAELGCGIAEWSIRAVEAGALRAYGFELDYETFLSAKNHVAEAAKTGRIKAGSVIVLNKDVLEVDLGKYGASIAFAFLDDSLLAQLAQNGVFTGVRKVVSPFHEIEMADKIGRQYEDLWLYAESASDLPRVPRKRYAFTPLQIAESSQSKPDEPVVKANKYSDVYIVKLTAPWCGPCKQFDRDELPKLKKLKIEVVKINVDEDRRFGGMSIPAFAICRKSTKTKLKNGWFVGYRSAKFLQQQLDKHTPSEAPVKTRTMISRLEGVVLPEVLREALEHTDAIWTNRDDHPALQHTDHNTYRLGYNMAARKQLSATGSPNNEKPWRFSGGCDAFADQLDGEVCYYFPSNVRVWQERKEVPGFEAATGLATRWAGEYPIGTVGAEFLSTNGELHAIRYRAKTDDGWYGEQIDISSMPIGYVAVDNCTACHSDIGRHANEIDNKQEWYSHVRGFEKDGFFNSPFMTMTGDGFGREDFQWDNKHFLAIE